MINTVIITINIPERKIEKDIECSANATLGTVLNVIMPQILASTAEAKGNYTIYADTLGRYLGAEETLEEAGVWDGAILTIKKAR